MARRPTGARISMGLLAVVFAAIAFGGAAALLAGPAAPYTPTPPGSSAPLPYGLVGTIIGVTVLAFCGLWIASHLFQRLTSGSIGIPGRALVTFLVVLLLCLGFILVARFSSGEGGFLSSGPRPNPNGTATNASFNNTTAPPSLGQLHVAGTVVPGWVLLTLLLAVALTAAIAVPLVAARRGQAEPRTAPPPPSVRAELASALDALESDPDAEVRAVIVALYARLLVRLRPTFSHLDAMAPREIEAESVTRLGVGPGTARDLTRLFEEARYSSHPLVADLRDRARVVFARALEDIDRRPGAL